LKENSIETRKIVGHVAASKSTHPAAENPKQYKNIRNPYVRPRA
jgi:hypothetical protein